MINKVFLRASWILLCLLLVSPGRVRADVGIILYESKGVDVRRTGTGHISLISTSLCPDGIDTVRKCNSDEEPGAIITRYANVAAGRASSIFVRPIKDHFTATANQALTPALSAGGTLEAMQMEYWRLNLKPYLPPLSQERYEEMRKELDRFDAGRTFRRILTMDYLMALLGPHKKRFPTEPIAIIHPVTKELIPNGRWRESVGAQHARSSLILTVSTTPEQEMRLVDYMKVAGPREFNALVDNCSDFVSGGLVAVFGDAGYRTRPRILHVADAWITTPLAVATDFVSFSKREKLDLNVELVPMIAGTRRATAEITSISRGALVPDASQGKMAFFMKVYFNYLNPLLGLLSFTSDEATRFVNVEDLVHERGSAQLSRMANTLARESKATAEEKRAYRREQINTFGTVSCWQTKRDEFKKLEAQAGEVGILSPVEKALLLKQGQPFLLPRHYESTAATRGYEGSLVAGMQDCAVPACGRGFAKAMFGNVELKEIGTDAPAGFVPGRDEVRRLANSDSKSQQAVAFRIMTALINYDLSTEPITRRTTDRFDPDWKLYLEVAQKNGLKVPEESGTREALAACSCREFDAGKATKDAYQLDRSLKNKLAREVRGLYAAPNR